MIMTTVAAAEADEWKTMAAKAGIDMEQTDDGRRQRIVTWLAPSRGNCPSGSNSGGAYAGCCDSLLVQLSQKPDNKAPVLLPPSVRPAVTT